MVKQETPFVFMGNSAGRGYYSVVDDNVGQGRLATLRTKPTLDNVHLTITNFEWGQAYSIETKNNAWQSVWMPLLPPAPVVYRCLSKCDVLTRFAAAPDGAAVRRNLPPSVIYDAGRIPLAADLVALDAPYWIKADAAHAL